MNVTAMSTGQLLRFQFECRPALFFDRHASIGQLRR